jgi:type I restriction-modification system DNA methylase subunit
LTPPHIADLFACLAEVNEKSVVFDNCCGTAGLLIAAMRVMLERAGVNESKIQAIKGHQLIGIEFQDNIYALAVSNMIVHDDGKTNVISGDCFELWQTVRDKWRPTVGLLNPPYSTPGGNHEELDFVLNNLEALQPSGRCVAIVPISSAIGEDSKTQERKRRLLERHTLEAVMSMPVDLFHDSEASAVTCIMVITAHKPHPKGKKTWFGYWRDDGFIKVKDKGRVDVNNTWETTKNRWLTAFRNRELIDRFSVMREVSATDEWCAEAYMEPDWSHLDREALIKTFKAYAVHQLLVEVGDAEGD